jgi:hypothetical protein
MEAKDIMESAQIWLSIQRVWAGALVIAMVGAVVVGFAVLIREMARDLGWKFVLALFLGGGFIIGGVASCVNLYGYS